MMTKTLMAAAAILMASPVAAQTTTTCRYIVAGAPQYGVTCDTQPQYAQPRSNGMPTAQLQLDDGSSAVDQSLRQRELRLREAEAGIAPPAAPTTGQRARRALFGF